ncbi:hypothetical protein ES703_75431 [subsurface metagenome]
MTIPLADNATKEIENTSNIKEADLWSDWELERLETNGGGTLSRFRREESGELVTRIETKAQSEREFWVDNYYAYPGVPVNARALIHDNDAAVGGVAAVSGTVIISGGVAVGGAVVIGGGVAVDSNAVFSGGLTIRGQMPTAHFYIWPAAEEPRDLTRDLGKLSWNKCRQVLFAFTSYAKEILKLKGIAITETRIRNWQAIEDTNWTQCILDITVKAKSHIALSIWDELSEELQQFINTQPEVFRPFLKDKLSLDVKWV